MHSKNSYSVFITQQNGFNYNDEEGNLKHHVQFYDHFISRQIADSASIIMTSDLQIVTLVSIVKRHIKTSASNAIKVLKVL